MATANGGGFDGVGRARDAGGAWNRDLNWANDTVVPALNNSLKTGAALSGIANIEVLDLQDSLVGPRLCETGVGLLEEVGIATWQSPGAVDRTEWVEQIRTTGLSG